MTTLPAVLGRGAAWLQRRLLTPDYPLTAVEIRARTVGVVRLVRERKGVRLGSAACLELPEGALRISMTEPNVADPVAFRAVLTAALERAGAAGGGPVALVLPDPVARVALVPAAEVKTSRSAEVDEFLRFRLRKAVPFEIREARLASVTVGEPGHATLVVGAIYRPVLEGYEEACRSVGLHTGLVELAGLTLAEAAVRGRAVDDRLVVNWDEGYASLILVRAGVPALVRTLMAGAVATPDQVAREVANTALYYRERLGGVGLAGAALRCTVLPPAEAAALFQEPLGLTAEILDPLAALGVSGLDAAPALAGAAACVVGRAA